MGSRRPNVSQRRLAQVRALKDQFFDDEPNLDDLIHAKDRRIAELERQVELLTLRLERQRPEAENDGPTAAQSTS